MVPIISTSSRFLGIRKSETFSCYLEIAKFLIQNGADPEAKNNEAKKFASMNGHLEMVKLLISLGVDVTTNDNFVLRYASYDGYFEIVKILIQNGADITANDNEAVKFALKNGSDYLDLVEISRNPKKFHFFVTSRNSKIFGFAWSRCRYVNFILNKKLKK